MRAEVSEESGGLGTRKSRSHLRSLGLGAGVLMGWGILWGLAHALDATVTQPSWRTGITVGAMLATAAAALVVGVVARRRVSFAADLVVVSTSVGVAGLATVALHGTRWAFSSLWSDAYFRTQMATRYSENIALVDYNYRDLPAYYPPALGWVQGRTADLLGIPAWEAIKPVQIVLAAAVPLLAYALWRRVLPPLPAALVVSATTLVTVHLQKPDEWLVMACLLPWWIEVVRGARHPAVADWSVWRHGLVLGLLLLTHTFFFLPLAVATVLGMVVDLVVRRALVLPLKRALLIGAVGLAVSAPYWFAMVVPRVRGTPSDSLQMRYSYDGAYEPPLPLSLDLRGLLWAVGIGWLLWAAWRWRRHGHGDRVAGGLALALVGCYLTLLVGAVAARYDIGLLAFKATPLVIAIHVTCSVLGLVSGLTWLLHRSTWRRASYAVVTAVGAALAVGLMNFFTTYWIVDERAMKPQITRYPDGSWPEGQAGMEPFWYPARVDAGDPSVAEVLATWDQISGGLPRSETVLATTRADLLATTPVYGFVPLKSIYSNPYAQFEGRVALLRQAAGCPDARCAAELLRENPYDRVDGLILERKGTVLSLAVYVDNFPNRTVLDPVNFSAKLFQPPYFQRRDIGRLSVIAVR
jgi:galactan 5-O-arabinofuranosyltransferase